MFVSFTAFQVIILRKYSSMCVLFMVIKRTFFGTILYFQRCEEQVILAQRYMNIK